MGGESLQNKSPAAALSPFFSCRSNIVHNHFGYSSSASATGSCLSFKKLRPLSGVPAGTELRTKGAFFSAGFPSFFAAGVIGSLKGCAAEVDVAAGGVWDDEAEPCRGAGVELAETGVALRMGFVVKAREAAMDVEGGIRTREAARRQVRQIIVGGWMRNCVFGWERCLGLQKFKMARENDSPRVACGRVRVPIDVSCHCMNTSILNENYSRWKRTVFLQERLLRRLLSNVIIASFLVRSTPNLDIAYANPKT